jgi:hypothetical protein
MGAVIMTVHALQTQILVKILVKKHWSNNTGQILLAVIMTVRALQRSSNPWKFGRRGTVPGCYRVCQLLGARTDLSIGLRTNLSLHCSMLLESDGSLHNLELSGE